MASKSSASAALFLSLNLILFAFANGGGIATMPGTCSINALDLRVCANLLGGLVGVVVGNQPACCSLIAGLVDLEAAVCLCTAIKANVLGINLDVPIALQAVLNNCGRQCPIGFQCP